MEVVVYLDKQLEEFTNNENVYILWPRYFNSYINIIVSFHKYKTAIGTYLYDTCTNI